MTGKRHPWRFLRQRRGFPGRDRRGSGFRKDKKGVAKRFARADGTLPRGSRAGFVDPGRAGSSSL
ncbi:hypothetical protein [Luteimonas mephitis]|uniref:hypothetical protein n=1 Tax=Luteimonas mephitis TaxID=83615 RepID=UPI00146E5C94|nr:hypothetical protein [Luteimonas mephitis]